ncbi:hypothetical protein OEM_28880 [Mycobacterium intracellulare subsp. yongonense 05-1390]|nr:hypothetical protein OEM_28880 [Mycobacterium intracellulare subsp. yongonense 05-1390]ARR78551.1 hypothetical protein MOTT12_02887 [Mycobacterium intracellulare subsp. yongonense]ARR83627.1 hypothetical protein MOTT27_02806 [Mycobacterium intracellulare subsp. yongonense]
MHQRGVTKSQELRGRTVRRGCHVSHCDLLFTGLEHIYLMFAHYGRSVADLD